MSEYSKEDIQAWVEYFQLLIEIDKKHKITESSKEASA